jgi:hypothetical protein
MFDINEFKRKVKEWMSAHPHGESAELLDFCEEIIPAPQFAANRWLVDQTISWYQHILQNRKHTNEPLDNESDEG